MSHPICNHCGIEYPLEPGTRKPRGGYVHDQKITYFLACSTCNRALNRKGVRRWGSYSISADRPYWNWRFVPVKGTRDSQRSKVYAAEQAAFGAAARLDHADAKRYCRTVLVEEGLGRVTIKSTRRRDGGCWARKSEIGLSRDGVAKWLVLHEVAHVVAWENEPAGHGPEFAGTYLELVYRHLGVDAARKLRDQFDAHRVKYHVAARVR